MHKYCCGNALENQQSITACGKGALGRVALGWAGKRHGDWTTLCHGGLKYAQYSRPCSPGRLSRCRFHNRPYNLHQGVHVTRRKICVLFFLSVRGSLDYRATGVC
jgi:hypothetical protein